jgi:hypothetical protein
MCCVLHQNLALALLPAEERPIEGEAFALLNDRTLGALVGAIGAHLDATLK